MLWSKGSRVVCRRVVWGSRDRAGSKQDNLGNARVSYHRLGAIIRQHTMRAATHEASNSFSVSCSRRCVDQCDPLCGRATLAPCVLRESCGLRCASISQ